MSPRLFLAAGEPSGDALGAALIAGLRQLCGPGLTVEGVGGPLMEAQGLASRFPMRELSVMGLAEVLPRVPNLLRRIRQTAAAVAEMAPDALVTIDSPDFTLRVARRAILISDSNRFGQGSRMERLTKRLLASLGLWRSFDWVLTRGKGYRISEGDGLFYSYSLFDNYGQIRDACSRVHVLNTAGGGRHALMDASAVAIVGIK